MRKMLFLLLLLPALSFAQSDESIAAFTISKPDSLGKPVPQLNGIKFNHLYSIRELGLKRKYIYTITTEAEYKTVFNRYQNDSLPVFDFSKQELVVYAACGQCMIVCNHHEKRNESCHRNACHFQQAWYVREKKEQLIVSN
jgi:hypothetical protein